MKLHIGVDDAPGLIHSLATTSANAHDITQADKRLHGKEECVWGDAGYRGIEKREEHQPIACVGWIYQSDREQEIPALLMAYA